MNKKYIAILISCILALFIAIFWLLFFRIEKKMVYANPNELIDGFRMTKEITSSGQKDYNRRVKKIDSLYGAMKNGATDYNALLIQSIVNEKDSLKAYRDRYTNEQAITIKKRIQSYANDFATENNYQLVIGGELINCSTSENDVTEKLLTYINKRYEGIH